MNARVNIFNILRTYVLSAALLVTAAGAGAREAIDFFTMPEAAVPLVDTNTRLDMTDYFRSGMHRPSKNTVDEPCVILGAEASAVTFQPAPDVETTLAVLTGGKADTVLMTVTTIRLPQAESEVAFYDSSWQPLAKSPLVAPLLKDWLTAEGASERDAVESWLPFIITSAAYDPAAKRLTFSNNMKEYYAGDEDLALLDRWIRPSLSYVFDGKRFRPEK